MLCLSLLTGCAKQQNVTEKTAEKENMPGWQLHAQEKVAFDWYINYSWFTTEWGKNAVSKAITEATGVDINFITPAGNEAEKLNALIASKSLPDLITLGWWEPQMNEMIQGDMVYALNELADKYDTYFWEVSDPQAVDWYTQADGNIYGYPNSSVTPKDVEENDNIGSNQTFLVRKDIYEAIGSPDMTTIDGFYQAVKKAAKMFPEINGKPLIPIGAHVFDDTGNVSFDQYIQNFLAVPYEKDGALYDRDTDPEYIEWLKMFRRLNAEGCLATDIFIDQRTQMEEKIAEGRYFCMLYQYTDISAQQKELYANDPDSIYIAIDGPKNHNGDDHVLPTNTASGWTVTMISKNCKHPDRAMQFMDYLISEEGQKMVYLGVEGVTYDVVDGQPVLKEKVKKLLNTNRQKYDALYGADDA
ncbi:MAG: extracellular solute-binding protein, partial [Acetatifactor sp.]|nr:extracellular solute-binding protein [Acetatifactor sp.]